MGKSHHVRILIINDGYRYPEDATIINKTRGLPCVLAYGPTQNQYGTICSGCFQRFSPSVN